MEGATVPIVLGATNRGYVSEVEAYESETENKHPNENQGKEKGEKKKSTILRRLSSIRSMRPSIKKVRQGFQKVSCIKGQKDEEEEVPFTEVPRQKSFDIGVGIARRMSLFIFTKKASCVHPYHPYYPKQTTRKIYVIHEDKH